jgi:hypothetical protein
VGQRDGHRLARAAARVGALPHAQAAGQKDCHPDPADGCLAAEAPGAGDRLLAAAQAGVHAQHQAARAEAATLATWTAAGSHRVADGYRQAAAVVDGAAAADDSPSVRARNTTVARDSSDPNTCQSKT